MPEPRLPRELLFGNPEKASPRISPDGRSFAYLAPAEGVLNLWAGPLGGEARPVTSDRGRGIRHWFWGGDGSLLYLQDRGGDENWHLHQARADGALPRDLTPIPGVQAQVVGTDPGFPDQVLVGLNDRDPRVHDVFRIDLRTADRSLSARNPGDVVGWLADHRLEVRAAKAVRSDGGSELRVRDAGEWRTLLSWGPEDQGGAHGFTPDGAALYVESSQGRDTTALWEAPLDGSAPSLLAARDGADLSGILLHPASRRVQAAAFMGGRLSWTALDQAWRGDFERLARLLPGDLQIASRDDADRTWFVLCVQDTAPPSYYRYDRAEARASLLFSTQSRLTGLPLSPMKAVSIPARDGLSLPAYLTLPAGRAGRPWPLVLRVHGGPWARDSWGFSPEVQWLADQGCAVLQVNFRGSAGFGKRFLHAGDREWGAKMQDDLGDAVAWAVREGVADPERAAIFGASYGGYAALCGAAFTPKLFRCAVDVVGPSNLLTLIRSIPPYWEPLRRVFDLRVGDAEKEPGFLESRSPLFAADRIEIPLLIAQGAQDPRVKRAESEAIVSALRAKGKPVEYLVFDDEGHGFQKPENRLRFYAAAERFLAEHLLDRP